MVCEFGGRECTYLALLYTFLQADPKRREEAIAAAKRSTPNRVSRKYLTGTKDWEVGGGRERMFFFLLALSLPRFGIQA